MPKGPPIARGLYTSSLTGYPINAVPYENACNNHYCLPIYATVFQSVM